MDQRHDNINFKAHILEEGIMSGGWGRASLPAQIIAIFQGHLSQWVKGTYSKEVDVGKSIGNWGLNKKIKS